MKKIYLLKTILIAFALVSFCSCDDFFNPDNGTVKYGDDYIKEGSELYSGYVGVITKLQAIGDKAIYLTDTRAEMLEPTGNSPELLAIYNYEANLKGNSYADPAQYYDLIIACNDYLHKARDYKNTHQASIDMDHYKGLISGILRLKAWTYLTMGKIYGEAVWSDDPMWKLNDFSEDDILNLDEIIKACVKLLDTGFDEVDGTHEMSWTKWISASEGSDVNANAFYYWDIMIPQYFILSAELALWQNEYQKVVDLILPKMNETFAASNGSTSSITTWMMTQGYANNYSKIFNHTDIQSWAAVSVISYFSLKEQTNGIVKHFASDYSLRPSVVVHDYYSDPQFNPLKDGLASNDKRYSNFYETNTSGNLVFRKYGKSRRDTPVYIYRSSELYMMLIEAFNHLGRYDEMYGLMNRGVNYYFSAGGVTWEGFTDYWTRVSRNYPDLGIRGVVGGLPREFKPCDSEGNKKFNDMEILHEIILEQAGEGKTYAAMLRMARRYNDYNIIADLVCPKYEDSKQADIRNKILNGGYFVPWDIKSVSSSH